MVMYQYHFEKKVYWTLFIIVHFKLFLFLSLLRIFGSALWIFMKLCRGVKFLSQEWTKQWTDDIPFCHKIPCNTFLTHFFLFSALFTHVFSLVGSLSTFVYASCCYSHAYPCLFLQLKTMQRLKRQTKMLCKTFVSHSVILAL